MRLRDITMNEYVDKFGKMTEKYFIQYMEDKGQKVDWVEKMRWTNYNAMYNKLVDAGKITGQYANSRYWIRAFRNDHSNIEKFISMIRNDGTINESVTLNEKLLEIDDDVDRIYEAYFKEIIDGLNNKEFNTVKDFKQAIKRNIVKVSLDTLIKEGIIQSPELIELNDKHKGVLFEFNSDRTNGGLYSPKLRRVSISMYVEPISLLIQNDYDLDAVSDIIGKNRIGTFVNEYSPKKIKGTIHHEIAHLYDDVMHNKNIDKWISNRQKFNSTYDRHINPVNVTPFEIEGVMHTIKQFKKNTDDWDELSFNDLFDIVPSLYGIRHEYFPGRPEIWEKWKKLVLKRMARENLLGDSMR